MPHACNLSLDTIARAMSAGNPIKLISVDGKAHSGVVTSIAVEGGRDMFLVIVAGVQTCIHTR